MHHEIPNHSFIEYFILDPLSIKSYSHLQMINIIFADHQVHSDAAWDNAVKTPIWENYS